jgi:hypothetical protein
MKFTHRNGYEELADFRRIIWKNLLEKSRKIVQALRDLGLEPVNDANKVRYHFDPWTGSLINN